MIKKRNPLFWGRRELNLLQHFALEALEDILNANFLFVRIIENVTEDNENDVLHYLYGESPRKDIREYKMYRIPCRVEYEVGEPASEEVGMRSVRKLRLHLLRNVLKEFDYFPQPGDLVLGESRRWYEIVNVRTDEQFFMAAFDTDDDFNFSVTVEAVEISQSKYRDIPIDVSKIPPDITVTDINITLHFPVITTPGTIVIP